MDFTNPEKPWMVPQTQAVACNKNSDFDIFKGLKSRILVNLDHFKPRRWTWSSLSGIHTAGWKQMRVLMVEQKWETEGITASNNHLWQIRGSSTNAPRTPWLHGWTPLPSKSTATAWSTYVRQPFSAKKPETTSTILLSSAVWHLLGANCLGVVGNGGDELGHESLNRIMNSWWIMVSSDGEFGSVIGSVMAEDTKQQLTNNRCTKTRSGCTRWLFVRFSAHGLEEPRIKQLDLEP